MAHQSAGQRRPPLGVTGVSLLPHRLCTHPAALGRLELKGDPQPVEDHHPQAVFGLAAGDLGGIARLKRQAVEADWAGAVGEAEDIPPVGVAEVRLLDVLHRQASVRAVAIGQGDSVLVEFVPGVGDE